MLREVTSFLRKFYFKAFNYVKIKTCWVIITIFFYSDEGVNFAVQKGLEASRSDVRFFKHNDMKDLNRLLEAQNAKELKVFYFEFYQYFTKFWFLYNICNPSLGSQKFKKCPKISCCWRCLHEQWRYLSPSWDCRIKNQV